MPYAENGRVRVYYEVEGDGPPLVLHTGFMGRLQDWRREDVAVAQALRDEYRLILMDPRGHGRSDKPHDAAAYALETRVRDVTAVLDAEGLGRAHFWGYSMGGGLGFALGIYAAARCHSLTLGGFAPYGDFRAGNRQHAAELREGTMADFVARMEARAGAAFPPAAREGLLANDPLALAAFREARATDPDLGDRVATRRSSTRATETARLRGRNGRRRPSRDLPSWPCRG